MGRNVMKKHLLFFLLIMLAILNANGQVIDSRGKDFWITFMPNYHIYKYNANPLFSQSDSIYIFISAEEPTNGTIEYFDIMGNNYTTNFSITDPSKIYVFKLPFNNFEILGFNDMGIEWRQNMDEIPTKLSFHLTTDKFVNVYAHSQGNKSSDAFLVLPTPSLGKEYFVLAYKSDGYFNSAGGRTPSQFAIVATEDNTTVNIDPSGPTFANGVVGQRITLNKGQVYLVQALIEDNLPLNDLTGTYVSADKPIAVFAGHQRATVPVESFQTSTNPSRDFLCEQLPPIQAWGKSAYIVPFPQPKLITNRGSDLYRVLAANDSTQVFFNGQFIGNLNRGQYLEKRIEEAGTVSATGPILVAVYKKTSNDAGSSYISDPFMMIIPPEEQFIDSCKLINIQAYEIQDNLQFQKVYQEHYITLIVPSNALTTTKIDGATVAPNLFVKIPNSNYYYAHVSVSEGKHSVSSTVPIGVYAFGYGPANSYGYIGGMSFQGRDWSIPKVVFDSTYCFERYLTFADNGDFDTGIESINLGSNSKNVLLEIDPKFKPHDKKVNVTLRLDDPYQDGIFFLTVTDSLQNQLYFNGTIPGFTLKHPSGAPNKYQIIQTNYIPNTADTIVLPVQNYGSTDIKVTAINIKTTVNFQSLNTLPFVVRANSIDSLRFVLNDNPTRTDTIFISLANECIEGKFVALVFSKSNCDITEFEFPTFENPLKIIFVDNAVRVGNYIQLTSAIVNRAGAIWYADPLPVISGFKTEFSFRIRSGSNNTCEDNSIPGADGLAFVIQNFMPYAIGNIGGGIGYDGIPNSVAIEFDTFSNDSTQIENFFDPNGNHLAVQSNGRLENSSKHTPKTTLGINTNIIQLKTDGTVYYSMIIYTEKTKTLEIYLDTTREFSEPVLVVNNFDLFNLLKLERGYRAYLGFTSATGCAYETHELLSWYVCPTPPDPTRGVEPDPVYYEQLVYPNPVHDFAYLNIPDISSPCSVRIINALGRVLLEQQNLSEPIRLNFSAFPQGIYVVEVSTPNQKVFVKVVKI